MGQEIVRRTPQSQTQRPTTVEMLEKIEFVRDCLRVGMFKSKIKRAFRARFGPTPEHPDRPVPSAGTIEDYLRRAREAREREGDKVDRRSDMGEFLEGLMANPLIPPQVRVKAADQLATLEELYPPKEVKNRVVGAHIGDKDGPVQVAAVTFDIAKLTEKDKQAIVIAYDALRRAAETDQQQGLGRGSVEESSWLLDFQQPGEVRMAPSPPNGQHEAG